MEHQVRRAIAEHCIKMADERGDPPLDALVKPGHESGVWKVAPSGKSPRQVSGAQIFLFTEIPIWRIVRAIPALQKGRIAIVTMRGPGCDGRDGVGREKPRRAAFRGRERRPRAERHGADSVFARPRR